MYFHIETSFAELPIFWSLMSIFVPIFLYAELHYRFPFFPFSRYYRKEPEIIADMPHRLRPGAEVPLLILIKDADMFPVHLRSVEVEMRDDMGNHKEVFLEKELNISQQWWHDIIQIDVGDMAGNCRTEVIFNYTVSGKERRCVNDNSPGLKEPFVSRLSSSPLPGEQEGWIWGDIHSHSYLTDDFVEFGAPIEAIQKAAEASELGFVAITDHSYNLDDVPGSWTESDPDLTKWNRFLGEVENLNGRGRSLLIPGEEVSVTNIKGKNVHLLVLNHPEYVPGSGDSGERWFQTRSERSIRDVAKSLKDNSLAIASHPKWRPSFLQRLLLKRGPWSLEDLGLPGITGMQIVNGAFNTEFEEGVDDWSRLLLKGEKRFIYAGNDAHGNFNLFRQVKHPMLSLWQHRSQILGKCRTGIYLPGQPSVTSILSALRKGNCVVSNGPLAILNVDNHASTVTLGESINGNNIEVFVNSISSQEYGNLAELKFKFGDLNRREERTLYAETFTPLVQEAKSSTRLDARNLRGYVRAELSSVNSEGEEFACYTNPVWIND